MKRAFIENKLEQAAKNGDTKKIKVLQRRSVFG